MVILLKQFMEMFTCFVLNLCFSYFHTVGHFSAQ